MVIDTNKSNFTYKFGSVVVSATDFLPYVGRSKLLGGGVQKFKKALEHG